MENQTINPTNFATQPAKAKLDSKKIVKQIARIIRAEGITYEQWRNISQRVRKVCHLGPTRKGRTLPNVLTADQFKRFFKAIDCGPSEHGLIIRTLFFSGLRVAELCNLLAEDVDLESCKIRVNNGKGRKDRYTLIPKSFAIALKSHLGNHPKNRWLFQSRQNKAFTPRRIQQIVSTYAAQAGIEASPHTMRHQALTWLTRNSGLCDAEIQLLSGHAKRETLAIYQHIALDADLENKYQTAMRMVEI